jgi:hypothetical protein
MPTGRLDSPSPTKLPRRISLQLTRMALLRLALARRVLRSLQLLLQRLLLRRRHRDPLPPRELLPRSPLCLLHRWVGLHTPRLINLRRSIVMMMRVHSIGMLVSRMLQRSRPLNLKLPLLFMFHCLLRLRQCALDLPAKLPLISVGRAHPLSLPTLVLRTICGTIIPHSPPTIHPRLIRMSHLRTTRRHQLPALAPSRSYLTVIFVDYGMSCMSPACGHPSTPFAHTVVAVVSLGITSSFTFTSQALWSR